MLNLAALNIPVFGSIRGIVLILRYIYGINIYERKLNGQQKMFYCEPL